MDSNLHHMIDIEWAVAGSNLLPVVAGWTRWKANSKEMKVLVVLFTAYLLPLAFSFYLAHHYSNSLWLEGVYSQIVFVVLAWVFASWCRDKKVRALMIVCIVLECVVWIIAKLTFEGIMLFNSFTMPLSELFLCSMGVYLFLEMINEEHAPICNDPRFWVVGGTILYNVGTLPFYLVANQVLVASLRPFFLVWLTNAILVIVANTIYAMAFFAQLLRIRKLPSKDALCTQ